MHEAGKCWERGRLVRIPLHAYHSHSEDNQRLFSRCALSADGTSDGMKQAPPAES